MTEPPAGLNAGSGETAWRARGPSPTLLPPFPVEDPSQPDGTEVWLVTRYEDARSALADPRLSAHLPGKGMHASDPPEHTRVRRLFERAFTLRRVEALRPWIEYLTELLLAEMGGSDGVDLLATLAYPLPVTVVCELIGVPVYDREQIRRYAKRTAGHPESGDESAFRAPGTTFAEYVSELVQTTAPDVRYDLTEDAQPNLLRALLVATDGQDRLSQEEIVKMLALLLATGHHTTAHLIGNAIFALLRQPEQWEVLRRRPELVPNAIEECLRFDGPVEQVTYRLSLEPLTVGGVTIPAHRMVGVAIASANRDPDRFAEPDRLDVARPRPRHLGFGHGPHLCLGAPLARLQAEIAIGQLLARFPDLELAGPAEDLRYVVAGYPLHGLRTLPVRLHGRQRRHD